MAMSVLLHDAVSTLSAQAMHAYQQGDLADVVYADDTLVMAVSSRHLDEYLVANTAAGKRLDMELHWNKVQILLVTLSKAHQLCTHLRVT